MTNETNGMYMPVAPAYMNGNDGTFGGNGAWWIIILLAVLGYGNGFGGNGRGGAFINADLQRGFDQQSVMNAVNGVAGAVTAGFGNVQTTLCNGFSQAEISANARQMAGMQQNFDMLRAFDNCCCENRLAVAGLNTTVAQEGAATRAASAANTQAILDKLCQLELDGVKQNYEGQLRAMQTRLDAANTDIQSLRFAASQGGQTAQILANNDAQTQALLQYLMQNRGCCNNNNNCSCSNYGACCNNMAA